MAVDKKKMLSLLDQIEQAMPELKELAGGEDNDDEQEPDEDDQGPPPDDGSGAPPDDGSGLPGMPPPPPSMGKKKPY